MRKRHTGPPDRNGDKPSAPGRNRTPDKPRNSVDISETFSKGFGNVKEGQQLK